MARQRKHPPRRKRRGRFRLLYQLLSIVLVAAAVIAACVIFFRVNRVTVEGNVHYQAQDIIDVSGIQMGDNLVTLSGQEINQAICQALPYVEKVTLRRNFPDGVTLQVTERTAVAIVDSGQGRWLMAPDGYLLEPAGEEQLMAITGLEAVAPAAGSPIQVSQEDALTLDYVLELLGALESHGVVQACMDMDCSSASNIQVTYGIYRLKFPRGGNYSKMLEMLFTALSTTEMPEGEAGTFDFTVAEGEMIFSRGT